MIDIVKYYNQNVEGTKRIAIVSWDSLEDVDNRFGNEINPILVFVTACDYGTYGYEIEEYEANCNPHGGVARINNILRTAKCKNGKVVRWTTLKKS